MRATRENCRHRIQQGEAERCIVLSPSVFVAPMLAIFVIVGLDSDGGDRDSQLHSAQCVAGSGARVARSGTACRAPTEETATAKRTMWRCVARIANRAVALRWRRLRPTLLKGNGTAGAISTFPKFPQRKIFLVVLTACAGRVTRAVRERSGRPSLGKHGKRKLDELHGARKVERLRQSSEQYSVTARL